MDYLVLRSDLQRPPPPTPRYSPVPIPVSSPPQPIPSTTFQPPPTPTTTPSLPTIPPPSTPSPTHPSIPSSRTPVCFSCGGPHRIQQCPEMVCPTCLPHGLHHAGKQCPSGLSRLRAIPSRSRVVNACKSSASFLVDSGANRSLVTHDHFLERLRPTTSVIFQADGTPLPTVIEGNILKTNLIASVVPSLTENLLAVNDLVKDATVLRRAYVPML